MKLLWDSDKPPSTNDILDCLKDTKGWSVSTVITLTRRLTEKGFTAPLKVCRSHYFIPILSEEDYLKTVTKAFLEKLHNNSFKSLVTTLYSNNDISKEDIKELSKRLKEVQ